MKTKKLICILLCIAMILSALPILAVPAAEIGSEIAETSDAGFYGIETYEELRELLKSLETLDTTCNIVLQSDINQIDNKNNYELVVPANREVFFDLNGYSITRETQGNDSALFRVKSDAKLVMFDSSSAQTGSCTFFEGYSNYNKAVFMNDGGVLKIDGGYYEILSPYSQGECSVIRTTSGITEIYDGTFDSSSAWGGDTISVGHDAYFYDAPQVYICGGDFYGKYQSIDISPMNNFLPYGHLFPNVYVMGGNFYVCNKGTDKITPGFTYCNNGWGRVIIAEGTVYATSLNSIDQRYLSGSTKKLFSQTIDDFTGAYYEVTAPPMIMPSGEDKYGEFYYDRLALLCSKEMTRNYNEETYLKFKEQFDSIRNTLDTIYVNEFETESPVIKLINRTTDTERITWYVCDEASYNGNWTYLGDYDNVVQMQLPERPEEGKSLLVRCVITYSNVTTYQDIVRIEYAPLKTAETITSVELTGLTTPADGANPDFDLTPVQDGYYINGVFWTDYTDTASPVSMKESSVFESGHTYELQVWLRAKDGYKFRVDSDEWIDITATIDTREAEVSEAGNEIAAIIYMEFTIPESKVVSEVDVINVTHPLDGEIPDYNAFCLTQGCNVSMVQWYDVTDGTSVLMKENDTFKAGHIYRVDVMVEAEGYYTYLMVDGYNETIGYINGVKVSAYGSHDDTKLELYLEFPACEENPNKPTDSTKPTDPVISGILGDANEDGKVNVKDATTIQKHIASIVTLSQVGMVLADVDGNANINIKDATAIQKWVAGIETGFAIGSTV